MKDPGASGNTAKVAGTLVVCLQPVLLAQDLQRPNFAQVHPYAQVRPWPQ